MGFRTTAVGPVGGSGWVGDPAAVIAPPSLAGESVGELRWGWGWGRGWGGARGRGRGRGWGWGWEPGPGLGPGLG